MMAKRNNLNPMSEPGGKDGRQVRTNDFKAPHCQIVVAQLQDFAYLYRRTAFATHLLYSLRPNDPAQQPHHGELNPRNNLRGRGRAWLVVRALPTVADDPQPGGDLLDREPTDRSQPLDHTSRVLGGNLHPVNLTVRDTHSDPKSPKHDSINAHSGGGGW